MGRQWHARQAHDVAHQVRQELGQMADRRWSMTKAEQISLALRLSHLADAIDELAPVPSRAPERRWWRQRLDRLGAPPKPVRK